MSETASDCWGCLALLLRLVLLEPAGLRLLLLRKCHRQSASHRHLAYSQALRSQGLMLQWLMASALQLVLLRQVRLVPHSLTLTMSNLKTPCSSKARPPRKAKPPQQLLC